MDVLPKFVKTYDETIHSTTGMATSRVTDSDVLAIWKRMDAARKELVHFAKTATFRVGEQCALAKRRCGVSKLPNRISARKSSRPPN